MITIKVEQEVICTLSNPFALFPVPFPKQMWKWDRPLGPWPSSSSYPISQEGKWDFEVVRFSVHYYYYPIPQKGNGILLLCGFILAIIIIGVVVVKVNSVAVKLGQISLFFWSYLNETWWAHRPWGQ